MVDRQVAWISYLLSDARLWVQITFLSSNYLWPLFFDIIGYVLTFLLSFGGINQGTLYI